MKTLQKLHWDITELGMDVHRQVSQISFEIEMLVKSSPLLCTLHDRTHTLSIFPQSTSCYTDSWYTH